MCRVSLWPGNIPHCINLTVGETVFFPPEHALRAGFQAAAEGNKNHTPTDGITELREALSRKTYKDYWLKCNPESEIFARVGATEAVIAPLLAWLDPGEEVPIPNPRARVVYELSAPLAEGKPIHVPLLEANNWLSPRDVTSLITNKSRVIVLNYPNNPTSAAPPYGEIAALTLLWSVT